MQRQIGQVPLVPDVISRLCSTVPTEMRHYRDIVQACPGGGPVIPNQSLAVQRLERKIRTQESRFFFSSFFNECLIQKLFSPSFLLLPSHQLSFCLIHHYLHIILIISTLSTVPHDGFIRLCVMQTFLGANAPDTNTYTRKNMISFSCFVERYATYYK